MSFPFSIWPSAGAGGFYSILFILKPGFGTDSDLSDSEGNQESHKEEKAVLSWRSTRNVLKI